MENQLREKRLKLISDIRKILELTLDIDWNWYHVSVLNYLSIEGYQLSMEIETESLNAMYVSDEVIEEFLRTNKIIE